MIFKLYTTKSCFEAKDLEKFFKEYGFDKVEYVDVYQCTASAEAAQVDYLPTLLVNGVDKVVGKPAIVHYMLTNYHKVVNCDN